MTFITRIGVVGIATLIGISAISGCKTTSANRSAETTNSSKQNVGIRGTKIGDIAPDFTLEETNGTKVSLNDLKGNPAVLVFWTAWCPACKEEAPHINKLAAEFEPKGVRVIGINIGESDARISEGIKDFGIKYEVAKDKDAKVSKSYKVIGTPTIIFLDENGAVQYFGNELPQNYANQLNKSLGK